MLTQKKCHSLYRLGYSFSLNRSQKTGIVEVIFQVDQLMYWLMYWFNGMSTHLGLFYAESSWKHIHSISLMTFFPDCLKVFFFPIVMWYQIFLFDRYIWLIDKTLTNMSVWSNNKNMGNEGIYHIPQNSRLLYTHNHNYTYIYTYYKYMRNIIKCTAELQWTNEHTSL